MLAALIIPVSYTHLDVYKRQDPIGAVNILNTNRQLGQIDIFTQNVEMSMKELSTLDDLMDLARCV